LPATFGTGCAPERWLPDALPVHIGDVNVGPSSTEAIDLPDTTLWIVTAVEVVSDGGAGGGAAFMVVLLPHASNVWVFNMGANADSFHFRGSLVIPIFSGQQLQFDNPSDTPFEAFVSGLACPPYPI
jgi:hypothetical protein